MIRKAIYAFECEGSYEEILLMKWHIFIQITHADTCFLYKKRSSRPSAKSLLTFGNILILNSHFYKTEVRKNRVAETQE